MNEKKSEGVRNLSWYLSVLKVEGESRDICPYTWVLKLGNACFFYYYCLKTTSNIFWCPVVQYITSHFQIAIDVKTIIIEHVFIQTKCCVWGGEETKFYFELQIWPIIILLLYNCYLRMNCIVLFKLFTW